MTDDWEEDGGARWTPPEDAPGYRELAALETVAMSEIDAALTPLDDAGRARVPRWALDTFGPAAPEDAAPEATGKETADG